MMIGARFLGATAVSRAFAAVGLAAALIAGAASSALAMAGLERFHGVYVGVADVFRDGAVVERRDMDIAIEPFGEGGIALTWINVTLEDGARGYPGVVRRVNDLALEPDDDRAFLIEADRANPFAEKEDADVMTGDPVRWASLDGDSLWVYSFAVTESGGYELQIYERRLTETGLFLEFVSYVDGAVRRRIAGEAFRAE